jgi:ATP-dependent helicase/nuclease subunit A
MNRKIPPDNENRIKISSQLGKSFFVEAGAGSGKTHSLVERMTALVISGEAKVENIAAITFTRKAAAELKERFQIRLERVLAHKGSSSEENRAAGEALLNFDRAFLGTIHSFCGKLLRERSVEAGVDPAFEEIEEEDNLMYAEGAWNEYLETSALHGTGEMEWLISRGVEPYSLKDVFLKRSEYADVRPVLEDVSQPDLSIHKKEVMDFVRHVSSLMPSQEPEAGWDSVQSMIDRSRRLIGMGYAEDNRKFIHLAGVLSKKPNVTLNRWEGLSSKEIKDIKEDFEIFQERVISDAVRLWGEYLHKPIMEFVEKGVEEYRKWRKERSLLNFQDLLICTAAMLRGNREVRSYFKSRISRLLVDEFQDTDPIQAEIIMLLTGEDNSEDNWRQITPRGGALFVVGDPKQSIYRFRRADIDTYNIVKKIFEKGPGEVFSLEANFRSFPAIGSLANEVFEAIFPKKGTRYQAAFSPLRAMRETESGESGIFINPVEKVERNSAMKAARGDAQGIARWIKWAISGGIKLDRTESEKMAGHTQRPVPSDFMILTRGKARLYEYAKALENLGVPYEVSGTESFGESEELKEICRLFKCLAEPSDPVPLLAVLRGPLFGVSDVELYKFKKSGGEFSFLASAEGAGEAIEAAYEKLKELRGIVLRNSPGAAAEIIIERSGIFPLAVSGLMGSTRSGNIIKAMELLREDSIVEGMSFSELSERLENFLGSKGREEMGLFPAESNAVRIMNLHKAKGLEANVVFLADPLGSWKEFEPDTHIVRSGDESTGYFAVSKPKNKFSAKGGIFAFPPGWKEISEEEERYMNAEAKRLEYVALTRAKNILCVSVYKDKTGAKAPAWETIERAVMDCPAIKPGKIEVSEKLPFDITRDEWKKEKVLADDTLKRSFARSFELTSVTRRAKEGMTFEGGGSGSGREWGNLVHKALEACGKGLRDDLPELAVNWMVEENLDISQRDGLLKIADGIMTSDMWRRVTDSEEKYFEIPFSIAEGATVFTGAIDLVFKEADGWVIVDYKTDDFESDPGRKAAYKKQLEMYAGFWEKLTGEKVKDKLLYRV